MIPNYSLDTLGDFVGKELGVSDWVVVDQNMINQFAESTGDHQWIHVDAERCKRESPFGAPIAHGFLTLSMLVSLQMKLGTIPEGASRAMNCGVDQVKFQSPVLSGERVRARVTLKSVAAKGSDRLLLVTGNVMEVEGKDRPALTADLVAMVYR